MLHATNSNRHCHNPTRVTKDVSTNQVCIFTVLVTMFAELVSSPAIGTAKYSLHALSTDGWTGWVYLGSCHVVTSVNEINMLLQSHWLESGARHTNQSFWWRRRGSQLHQPWRRVPESHTCVHRCTSQQIFRTTDNDCTHAHTLLL